MCKSLMEEADFECSVNSRLLTRPYYEFHNVMANVTKLDSPTLSVTTSGFSDPWNTSGSTGRPHETSTAAIMDRQHRNLVDFLYARLRYARSTIEKLEPTDSIVGEMCHADEALPTKASENLLNNVSRSAEIGNMLSSSPQTITQQSTDLEPSQSYWLTSIPHSPINRPSRAESDPIQAHEPEGDTRNNTQGNLDSTKDIYSAWKRKRQSTKDPTKFKHECNTCGERFTRSTTLREHSRTHTNERPFPCSSCSKTFARKKDKTRHENLHLGEKTFYCSLDGQDAEGGCGRCFTREDGLVAHLRTERGWKCLQDLMASTYCQTHIPILLRHENGFSCELTQRGCHGKFDDFSDLKDHLQDRANKDCATEWLTKTFLRLNRTNRFARSFQDKDPDASEAERSDSSRHPTSQDRHEPSNLTSPPHDPQSTRGERESRACGRQGRYCRPCYMAYYRERGL